MPTKFLSSNPTQALERATTQLATTESEIVALRAERVAALRDYEDVESIAAIDAKIDHKGRTASILRDRVAALQEAERAAERKAREAERKVAVKAITATLDARKQAAAKLDSAAALLTQAFAELVAADEAVFAGWPDVMGPAHQFSYLRMLNIEAISNLRKQRAMTPGVIRHLVEKAPFDFAAEAEKRNAEFVAELQNAPASSPQRNTVAA